MWSYRALPVGTVVYIPNTQLTIPAHPMSPPSPNLHSIRKQRQPHVIQCDAGTIQTTFHPPKVKFVAHPHRVLAPSTTNPNADFCHEVNASNSTHPTIKKISKLKAEAPAFVPGKAKADQDKKEEKEPKVTNTQDEDHLYLKNRFEQLANTTIPFRPFNELDHDRALRKEEEKNKIPPRKPQEWKWSKPLASHSFFPRIPIPHGKAHEFTRTELAQIHFYLRIYSHPVDIYHISPASRFAKYFTSKPQADDIDDAKSAPVKFTP